MRRIMLLVHMLLLIGSFSTKGQSPKQETIKHSRNIFRLDTAQIKAGGQLEYAELYSVKQFIEYKAAYGELLGDKKWGSMWLEQLYQDTASTYFGRNSDLGLRTFFRVKNEELAGLNYKEFDAVSLRARFFAEIVPQPDKERVKRKGEGADINEINRWDFKYNYHPGSRLLEMTYRWKVPGKLTAAINKTYKARYDLNTKQFVRE